jgi:hypothetical protein
MAGEYFSYFLANAFVWIAREAICVGQMIKSNQRVMYLVNTVKAIFSGLYRMFRLRIDPDYRYNPTLGSGAELYFLPDSDFRMDELQELWPVGWQTIVCTNYSGFVDFRKEWTQFSFQTIMVAEETDENILYFYTRTSIPWNYLERSMVTMNKKWANFLQVITMLDKTQDGSKMDYWCRVRRSVTPPRASSIPSYPPLSLLWKKSSVYVEYNQPEVREPIIFSNFRQFMCPGNEILDRQFVEWILKMMDKGHLYQRDYKINILWSGGPDNKFQELEVGCGQYVLVEEDGLKLMADE